MRRLIEFYPNKNTLKKEIPYSDEKLLDVVKNFIVEIQADRIHVNFYDIDENFGGVWVSISNSNRAGIGEQRVIRLHRINLCEESYKDCLAECQREKRLLKKCFKNVIVTSNFR